MSFLFIWFVGFIYIFNFVILVFPLWYCSPLTKILVAGFGVGAVPFDESMALWASQFFSQLFSFGSSFFRTMMHRKRLRNVKAACPSSTFVTCSWKLSNWNGVKKPNEPKWNAITGGTDCWNNSDAYSNVPSPPKHTIKSMRSVKSSRPSLIQMKVSWEESEGNQDEIKKKEKNNRQHTQNLINHLNLNKMPFENYLWHIYILERHQFIFDFLKFFVF